jgi:hypothetical protein
MKWWIGSIAAGLAGAALVLSYIERYEPQTIPDATAPANPESQESRDPAPVVLQEVVDVTDLDALLDPPAIPFASEAEAGTTIIRVGYEEARPTPQPQGAVKPIPLSTDD